MKQTEHPLSDLQDSPHPLLPLLTDSPPHLPLLPHRTLPIASAHTHRPSPSPPLPSATPAKWPFPLPHRQSFSLTSLSASPNSQLNKTLGSVKEKESERNKDGFSVGQEVRLIFGKKENLGLKGTIVKRLGLDSIVLRVEKSGDPVLVLYGKHKGAYENLVQRDLGREFGVVQGLW
ncbi:hypothetical protein OIU79_020759 [Salix purpurea]|uniref:Uncharacterized protein n=1 Tax=Salix purpurea TaxID=77065 RepID=A0A9Q1AG87_SALPP|nr:hypothetical protein OIU79_020759 [Salix purpurea]